MRNIDFRLGTDTSPKKEVQTRGRHAVNVIVSVKADPLTSLNGQMKPIDGPFHIRQRKRIMGQAPGG